MKKHNKIKFKIKVDQTKLRNELHFEIQKSTRANVFRDRTKYRRQKKHKNNHNDFMD